jgi:hypothetical protein
MGRESWLRTGARAASVTGCGANDVFPCLPADAVPTTLFPCLPADPVPLRRMRCQRRYSPEVEKCRVCTPKWGLFPHAVNSPYIQRHESVSFYAWI